LLLRLPWLIVLLCQAVRGCTQATDVAGLRVSGGQAPETSHPELMRHKCDLALEWTCTVKTIVNPDAFVVKTSGYRRVRPDCQLSRNEPGRGNRPEFGEVHLRLLQPALTLHCKAE
jgi:hypothetical protein